MFKKRRQRSKKYTLTSFGSVDEDRCPDSQEEDGVFPGSESEFDEDGFSAVPDPTWDSDYLDMLEKRATAGTEGRADGAEDAPSPGLSDTAGKGAQLFEQQRKRAAEHAKKVEAAQQQTPAQSQVQEQPQMYHLHPDNTTDMQPQMQPNLQPQHMTPPGPTTVHQEFFQAPGPVAAHGISNGDLSYSAASTACMTSPPPVAPKPTTATVTVLTRPAPPPETPLPELSASNVLNRTARPFTPGFISIRASTAPVTFRPPVTKTIQRPASAAVVPPPFSTASEVNINVTSVTSLPPSGPQPMFAPPPAVPQATMAPTTETPVTIHPPAISTSVEKMPSSPPISTFHHAPFAAMPQVCMPSMPLAPQAPMAPAPVPFASQIHGAADPASPVPPLQVPVAQPAQTQFSMAPVATVSVISQPEAVAPTPVPGQTGRTGILLEARRRGGKPKPMFTVPDVTKKSPNPDLLCMVQNLDERSTRYKHGQPLSETIYDDTAEEISGEVGMGRAPPPVAPKPKVIHETPKFLQAGGKGAELFARRQSRMGMYVVDTPPETPYQQEVASHSAAQSLDSSNPSFPSQWKYSPNVRAPPPIGYNPLHAPSIPTGPQRDIGKPESRGRGVSQREGIKALDFMRRQPYQLNSAMFNYGGYGGSVANLSAMPSYQAQRQQQGDYTTTMVGNSLTPPKQIPTKTARVFEVKRFSTPTPMSAPTLAPKVIAPRSATTLGERLTHSDMTSPPPAHLAPIPLFTPAQISAPTLASPPSQPVGLPSLPKFNAIPIPNPVPHAVPTPYTPVSYNTGLQTAKQFQSAPELSILSSLPPLKSNPVQAPKPRFVATKGGVQPHVWRPGAM